MNQFIEEMWKLPVGEATLDAAYEAMAADQEREADAQEWCMGLAGDMADEIR